MQPSFGLGLKGWGLGFALGSAVGYGGMGVWGMGVWGPMGVWGFEVWGLVLVRV